MKADGSTPEDKRPKNAHMGTTDIFEPASRATVTLPDTLWEWIDHVVEENRALFPETPNINRNSVLAHFLREARADYEAKSSDKRAKK